MSNEKVSVLMCTYKEPKEYVRQAAESILKQSFPVYEYVIVIDDPHNDEVISYLESISETHPFVKLIFNDKNLGLVKSLNRGLEEITGDYICRMDADDIAKENRIEKQLAYLSANHLDLTGCAVEDIDEDNHVINQAVAFPEKHEQVAEYLKYNNALVHPSWLGKKEVFEKLCGYREIKACEDYDFAVRCVLSGFMLGNCPEVLLSYRINQKGISSTNRAIQKTSLFFLRDAYRKGNVISLEEYNGIFNTKQGLKKMKGLEKYYRLSAELKKKKGNKSAYLLHGMYMVLASSEARKVLINEYACKKILRGSH